MTRLTAGDANLHDKHGCHISTCPATGGNAVRMWEDRMQRHLTTHRRDAAVEIELHPHPKTYYGDPAEPIEEMLEHQQNTATPPSDGDELCDGHQAHYVWRDGGWQ